MNSKKKVLWFCMLSLFVIPAVAGCNTSGGSVSVVPAPALTAEPDPGYDMKILGVVKEVDDHLNSITIYDTGSKMDINLSYTGGTDVTDQYEQVIAMSKIKPGEMVDACYSKDKDKLIKLQISKDAWEYKGVNKLYINKADKIMKIGDRRYQYTDDLVVAGGDGLKSLMEISAEDEVTVKGISGKICSVIVTKGHGYIRLKGQDAFVGGYLEAGYNIFTAVTDNMLLTVREGQYEVRLRNGELEGSRSITVHPDEETVVDLSQYRITPDRVGRMNFIISPAGADLYVNGTLTDYEEPLELVYGKHDIKVVLNGYEEYNGRLKVGSAYEDIEISLAAARTEGEGDDTEITIEGEAGDEDEVTGSTGAGNQEDETTIENNTDTDDQPGDMVQYDEAHKVTIKSPVGAEVYVNGTYKGTAPVSFPKMTGSLTITFCREGYINSSHSIEVKDNNQDVTLSFPDLKKSNG